MERYFLLFILTFFSASCSVLDNFQLREKKEYFVNLGINCMSLTHDHYLSQTHSLTLDTFFIKKTYLFKNKINPDLQDLAEQDGITKKGVLSYYNYSVIPKQIITDRVEIEKDTILAIFLLKEENVVVDKAVIEILPNKKIQVVNLNLLGNKIVIQKNTK